MLDRIENEGFIALSEKTRRLMKLAYAQKEKIQEQEQMIKDLEQHVAELQEKEVELQRELNRLSTAQGLNGQGTDTDKAKVYIDEVLTKLRKSLQLVQSLEVVDYKGNR